MTFTAVGYVLNSDIHAIKQYATRNAAYEDWQEINKLCAEGGQNPRSTQCELVSSSIRERCVNATGYSINSLPRRKYDLSVGLL